jgi:hypothetical protein
LLKQFSASVKGRSSTNLEEKWSSSCGWWYNAVRTVALKADFDCSGPKAVKRWEQNIVKYMLQKLLKYRKKSEFWSWEAGNILRSISNNQGRA